MNKIFLSIAVGIACSAAAVLNATAGPIPMRVTKDVVVSDYPYEKGTWELQPMAGAYWDLGVFSGEPHFNYALESLRGGYMVTNLTGHGWYRGNFEFLVEAMGGEFFDGPANYLVGGNVLFRWNFVQDGRQKFVPYIQIGGGGLYHDAVIDANVQKILGSNVEAMLHAGLGLRYHLNSKWSIDGEFGYRHISNASTTEHNLGLNCLGGQLGFSYFF